MVEYLEIPQDIIDNVIAAVGDDRRLLLQCALVSSSFLLPSRKKLFSRITLSCDQSCQGIHQVFVRNPVIRSYVRAITLTESIWTLASEFPNWIYGTSLLAILRLPFCRLEYFSICGGLVNWNWNSFSCELKDALSNIIRSSTLKTLSLKGITNVPITLFFHLHLTTMELYLSPNDFFFDENSNSLTRIASKGMTPVAPIACHTVIDQCVWDLYRHSTTSSTRFPSSAISH